MNKFALLRNAIASSQKYIPPYVPIEYIECDGYQWIDTGLPNTGDYIFEDTFLVFTLTPSTPGSQSSDGNWIIGGRRNPNYSLGVFLGQDGLITGYGGTTMRRLPLLQTINEWIFLEFSRTYLYTTINGVKVKYATEIYGTIPEAYKTNILLGKNQMNWTQTGDDTRLMHGRRKKTKIFDATTGDLLRDMEAYRTQSGTPGMLDLHNNRFYKSAGSRSFIAGPDII